MSAEFALQKLEAALEKLGPVAIAVSGGVDSMTLAVVAHRLNPHNIPSHAVSPAVPTSATERVKQYAEREGWPLLLLDAKEFDDPHYLENPVNRCYFCKSNLYTRLREATDLPIVSGTNLDDLSDYRPGLTAAAEQNVHHPFVDAGIDKATLRNIAQYLGLSDIAELPAAPCLSSRITTGIPIDGKLLPVVDKIESHIWQQFGSDLELRAVRCRIQPEGIAIQLETTLELAENTALLEAMKKNTLHIAHNNGFSHYQQVSVEPYQKGSAFLIETINVEQ